MSDNKVYVASGFYFDSMEGDNGIVWENGKMKHRLEGGGRPKSIYAEGNNVYVVGDKLNNGKFIPMYWENGKAKTLGTNADDFNYVTGSKNKIYVAGTEIVNGKRVATVWINGVAHYLSNNPSIALFVSVK